MTFLTLLSNTKTKPCRSKVLKAHMYTGRSLEASVQSHTHALNPSPPRKVTASSWWSHSQGSSRGLRAQKTRLMHTAGAKCSRQETGQRQLSLTPDSVASGALGITQGRRARQTQGRGPEGLQHLRALRCQQGRGCPRDAKPSPGIRGAELHVWGLII